MCLPGGFFKFGLAVLFVACVLDCVTTLLCVGKYGVAAELNPLMASLLATGPVLFVFLKLAVSGISVVALYFCGRVSKPLKTDFFSRFTRCFCSATIFGLAAVMVYVVLSNVFVLVCFC
jgi:hypothetical protein